MRHRKSHHPLCMLLLCLSFGVARALQPSAPVPDGEPGAKALLLPDEMSGHGLILQNATLDWLRSIKSPVAIVTAIGQYRSGKSFLLNQLMQVPCDRGFGVGHRRETQTKGVWAYASDIVQNGSVKIYLDTEGFDATGKAAVYDDRIFAFSALVSSVLIYNLVETIKEADIEKLSFVAQLASEFWRRTHTQHSTGTSKPGRLLDAGSHGSGSGSSAGGKNGQRFGGGDAKSQQRSTRRHTAEWLPPALMWLVQRDFLQGSTVDAYLREALKPQQNPSNDEHSQQLNAIRAQLSTFDGGGGGMTGFGLPQPHVQRTALCELGPSALSPEYVSGLKHVRSWVLQRIDSRAGRIWHNGAELAAQVQQLVRVLNAQRIPTAGSIIEAFNRELVQKMVADLRTNMHQIILPMDTEALRVIATKAIAHARQSLNSEGFGTSSLDDFDSGSAGLISELNDRNFRESHGSCKRLWGICSAGLDSLKSARLPSRRRFHARIDSCNATLVQCVGPAADDFRSRLEEAASRGAQEYGERFLARLSQLLVLACISGVLIFRYLVVSSLGETLCWLLLIASEVLPRLNAVSNMSPVGGPTSSTSFWETPVGSAMLEGYEVMVYNEYADADDWLTFALLLMLTLFAIHRFYHCCKSCCGWDAGRKRRHLSRREASRRYRRTPRRRNFEPISDDDDYYEPGCDYEHSDYWISP